MARALLRDVVEDTDVKPADDYILSELGKALRCPKDTGSSAVRWPVS